MIAVALVGCSRGPRHAGDRDGRDAPAVTTPAALQDAGVEGRPLTRREEALLRPWFRDAIDYADVRVVDAPFSSLQPDGAYMTPRGRMYAPGDLYRADFGDPDAGIAMQAVFIHEMTHVWQYQSGKDLIAEAMLTYLEHHGDYERSYAYQLDPSRDLLDYGVEQQASIIEDYFLIRTHELGPGRLEDGPADPAVRDAQYQAVLAAFLADPGYARTINAAELARRHADVDDHTPPHAPTCAETPAEHARVHACGWRMGRLDPAAP